VRPVPPALGKAQPYEKGIFVREVPEPWETGGPALFGSQRQPEDREFSLANGPTNLYKKDVCPTPADRLTPRKLGKGHEIGGLLSDPCCSLFSINSLNTYLLSTHCILSTVLDVEIKN
jgi:hypothetical protein